MTISIVFMTLNSGYANKIQQLDSILDWTLHLL